MGRKAGKIWKSEAVKRKRVIEREKNGIGK